MPVSLPRDPASPVCLDELTGFAARIIDSLTGLDGGTGPITPAAVGFTGHDGALTDMTVGALWSDDPVDDLLGFDAPNDWVAFGILSSGRWRPIDSAPTGPWIGRGPAHGRAVLFHIVTRPGEALVAMARDGEPATSDRLAADGTWYGRVDDVCRRVLGLPTAPPLRPVTELWALVWLDIVIERALAGDRLDWPAIAAAHPAVGQLEPMLPGSVTWASDHLVELGEAHASAGSWGELRRRCAHGDVAFCGVGPDAARWMDDGMFSRWTTGSFPEVGELVTELSVLLAPSSCRRIHQTLAAWGL